MSRHVKGLSKRSDRLLMGSTFLFGIKKNQTHLFKPAKPKISLPNGAEAEEKVIHASVAGLAVALATRLHTQNQALGFGLAQLDTAPA